jgi:S-adenosylmethionine synthetase
VAAKNFIFSSESVSEGHPDKVADQISDAVLDAYLKQDPRSRVACETLVKNEYVIVAGEITSKASVDYNKIVRQVVREIGYDDPKLGFDSETCKINQFISEQSPDIAQGVDEGSGLFKEQGAGDQGLMFGFACNETPEYMPLPIALSHHLVRELANVRKSREVNFLRPDAKAQVSVEYTNGQPTHVNTVVVSTQHSEDVDLDTIREFVVENVVKKVVPAKFLSDKTKYLINPTGLFVIGGPVGDCGLTGRKIIVDTYGGYSRHGGGAFSGKDPSKVDRSAAYAARHIAKNVVAAGIADKCEVQIAYAIGVARPVSIFIDTFGTGRAPEDKISAAVNEIFDLTPKGIIQSLDLLKPIYRMTAAYGHFGRQDTKEGHFSWERLDKVEPLKAALLK